MGKRRADYPTRYDSKNYSNARESTPHTETDHARRRLPTLFQPLVGDRRFATRPRIARPHRHKIRKQTQASGTHARTRALPLVGLRGRQRVHLLLLVVKDHLRAQHGADAHTVPTQVFSVTRLFQRKAFVTPGSRAHDSVNHRKRSSCSVGWRDRSTHHSDAPSTGFRVSQSRHPKQLARRR